MRNHSHTNMQRHNQDRILHILLVFALLAGILLPLAPQRALHAQEAPTAPVEPAPQLVQPAAITGGGGPPLRSTIFNAAGSVTYPQQPRFNSTAAVTIEAWANITFRVGCQAIVDNEADSSYWFGACKVENLDAFTLRFKRGNTGFVETSQSFSFYGPRRHYAVSYDGVNVTMYVNGLPVGGGPLTAPPLVDKDLQIGGTKSGEYLQGTLDEVRIWSVARTQQQIQESIFQEVRSGAGLVATFGDGGMHEDLEALTGAAGAGIGAQPLGFLPKDLVVPLATTAPVLDGQVNPSVEYAGAEAMPMRFVRSDGDFFAAGQPEDGEVESYLLRTETDLYIGIPFVRLYSTTPLEDPWLGETSKVAVMLDLDYLRPELAQPAQNRILIDLSTLDPATSLWQDGNGSGDFANCAGVDCPARGALWDVQKASFFCGEFDPPCRSVEIRISKTLLGEWTEVDGMAIGQVLTPVPNMHHLGPVGALMGAPDTWATVAYSEEGASLPRVKVNGKAIDVLAPGSPPLVGHKVQLRVIGGTTFETTTDAGGLYAFDVVVPFNKSLDLRLEDCNFCRYQTATASVTGIQPVVLGNGATFNGCLSSLCELANITFRLRKPPGAVTIASPMASPVPQMVLNTATNAVTSQTTVVISGTNLHDDLTFFLSPVPVLPINEMDPAKWILYPAPVVSRGADMKSVTVRVPQLNRTTPTVQPNNSVAQTFSHDWRWIVRDNWSRPGWQDNVKSGGFRLAQPPYPEMWGMGFKNESTGSSFTEFTAVYGNNAYICVGAFGFCATHVPDPLYATIFYGIYRGIISQTGGSCVGMSATSEMMYNGFLSSATFDPNAPYPAGITVRPDADYDHDSTTDLIFGPARPANLWAYVRTHHGRQVSSSVWRMSAEQLIDSASDGFMQQQLQRLRAAPTSTVLSMKNPDAVFGGHAITPWRVIDQSADLSKVMVYDNNSPKSTTPFVDFNLNDDTFKFSGYSNTGGTLFVYPLSNFREAATFPADIPGMVGNVIFGDAGDASVVATGGEPVTPQNTTQALITTAAGQYGYLPDGTFVNTLPNAAPIPLLGANGENLVFSPVLLPVGDPAPTITVNANQERYFYMGAAGSAVLGLRGSEVTPGDRDTIKLAYDGQALAGYDLTPQRSSTELLPQLGMAEGEQERLLFRFWQLDIEGGTTAGFDLLPDQHGVLHRNGSGSESEHFIIVDAVDGAAQAVGTRIFGPIITPAGGAQRVTVADWPIARTLKVETDANGDGIFESTQTFGGRSCGSSDANDDGIPDACATGMSVYMPVINR